MSFFPLDKDKLIKRTLNLFALYFKEATFNKALWLIALA